jgi:hypothetical protein
MKEREGRGEGNGERKREGRQGSWPPNTKTLLRLWCKPTLSVTIKKTAIVIIDDKQIRPAQSSELQFGSPR